MSVVAFINESTQDYLWNYEPPCSTSCGDSLMLELEHASFEDLWFFTKTIFLVTEHFDRSIAIIRDEDGEFMLIEAAEVLPDWACSPEATRNRVFVFQGMLHWIPPETDSVDLPCLMDVRTGKDIILSLSRETLAPENIQAVLMDKLASARETAVAVNRHKSSCLLPNELGVAIARDPHLVGKILHALTSRPRSSLLLNNMKPLDSENLSYFLVRFTRLQFAKLLAAPFEVPRVLNDTQYRYSESDSPRHIKACVLGVKLFCGNEILQKLEGLTLHKNQEMPTEGIEHIGEPIHDDDSWLFLSEEECRSQAEKIEAALDPEVAGSFASATAESVKDFLFSESGIDGFEHTLDFDANDILDFLQGVENAGDDDDDFVLVDQEIDANLVENLMKSLEVDEANSPSLNILASLGLSSINPQN